MPHPATDDLTISAAGLALITRFEGFAPDWYDDPVGVRTIGYGWTGALPDGVEPPLTEPEARDLLARTVGAYEQAVRRHVSVPLAQPQFDALVSFTYNVGASNLASSTLVAKLNEGKGAEAAAEFDRWVLAQGQRLEGLVRRRAAERALFESGLTTAPPPAPAPAPTPDPTPPPAPTPPPPPDAPAFPPPPPPPFDPPTPPTPGTMDRIAGRPGHDLGARDLPDLPSVDVPAPRVPPPPPDADPGPDDRTGW